MILHLGVACVRIVRRPRWTPHVLVGGYVSVSYLLPLWASLLGLSLTMWELREGQGLFKGLLLWGLASCRGSTLWCVFDSC